MLGPNLVGTKISLQPSSREDLPVFVQWFADTEVTRYLNLRVVPSHSQEEEWFDEIARSDSIVHWRIVAEGKTIGASAIADINWMHRQAMTGMMLGERTEWGKGYASEAVQLRTAFAFAELGLERLETRSRAGNVAMHRVLEKVGYRKIGLRRKVRWGDNGWQDEFIFELLREEWPAVQS